MRVVMNILAKARKREGLSNRNTDCENIFRSLSKLQEYINDRI